MTMLPELLRLCRKSSRDECQRGLLITDFPLKTERLWLKSLEAIMRALSKRGIGSQVHYIPLHLMPTFGEFIDETPMPGAMSYYEKCLSLPLYPGMEMEDVKSVVSALWDAIYG